MPKSYSISSKDLEEYVYSEAGVKEQHPFTGWMALQSQFQVDGLYKLREKLKESGVSIDEIRRDYAESLLTDLERVAKRPEVKDWGRPEFTAKFKSEFYEELKKAPGESSEEYKEFIQACSENFTAGRYTPEMVSLEALEELGKNGATIESLKDAVDSGVKKYKQDTLIQGNKDMTDRTTILYKGKDQETRRISLEELKSGENIALTREQRNFLCTCWQQGSFESAWFFSPAANGGIWNDRAPGAMKDERTQLFVDASSDAGVKVYNRLEISSPLVNDSGHAVLGAQDRQQNITMAEAVLTVDISGLQGDEFVPGCSSVKPPMQFDIEERDDLRGLFVPKGLKATQPAMAANGRMEISEYIKNEAAVGILGMIQSADKTISEEGWDRVSNFTTLELVANNVAEGELSQRKDKLIEKINEWTTGRKEPELYFKAVESYSKIVTDQDEKKEFAANKLGEYLEVHRSSVLDNRTLKKMETGIVEIMGAALGEKESLKKNVGKIIRSCAREQGKAMSWGQFRRSLVDRVVDFVDSRGGMRQTKAQKIMIDHPEVAKQVKTYLPKRDSRISRMHRAVTRRGRGSNKGEGMSP